MATPAQLIQLVPGEGPAFSAVGDVYRFLATGEQTGGAYVLSEARVLPGGGPPPHIHRREDEGFFVLEGEITFTLGDKRVVAKPGSFIQGPRDIPHTFKNVGTSTGKLLLTDIPGRFADYFIDVDKVPDGDRELIRKLCAKYDVEILE